MMDWFHSSQFGQQILGEGSGSNVRKGYKICSMTTDGDLDKSETPLLCEKTDKKPPVSTEKTKPKSENICSEPVILKKPTHGFGSICPEPVILKKPTHGFGSICSPTSEKEIVKTKAEPRALSMSYRQEGKSQESEKLLIDFGNSDDKDDDDDDM